MTIAHITKNTCERYVIRKDDFIAIVYLHDEFGDITIQSDRRSFGYYWFKGGRGTETLKEFLLRASVSYVMDKFSYGLGGHEHFCEEKTRKNLKKLILEKRRSGQIGPETARGALNDLTEIDFGAHLEGWLTCWENSYEFKKVFPDPYVTEGFVYDVDPQLRHFMERLWPEFIEVIRLEFNPKETNPE